VLSDEAAPWHLLNQNNFGTSGPIPQPSKGAVRAEDGEPVASSGAGQGQ
jgi:hypothetical protein